MNDLDDIAAIAARNMARLEEEARETGQDIRRLLHRETQAALRAIPRGVPVSPFLGPRPVTNHG